MSSAGPMGGKNRRGRSAWRRLLGPLGTVCLVPALLGLPILGVQTYLYLQDGVWYPVTALSILTCDVDPRLADAAGIAYLASWKEVYDASGPNPSFTALRERAELVQAPALPAWRIWLVYPQSWRGLSRAVRLVLDLFDLGLTGVVSGLVGMVAVRVSRPNDPVDQPAVYD